MMTGGGEMEMMTGGGEMEMMLGGGSIQYLRCTYRVRDSLYGDGTTHPVDDQ